MIETLVILYLLIGCMLSMAIWEAYIGDENASKVAPKWVWTVCITGACLVWPLLVIKYILDKRKESE